MINSKELRIGGMPNRLWGTYKGWGDYYISDYGNVYSIRRSKILKVWNSPHKYQRITLSKKGYEKSFCIHRLVATVFIPNPEGKKSINHKDGNKHNNHVSNLEWVTPYENTKHAVSLGLIAPFKNESGELHPAAKLNNVDIAMIKILCQNGFTQEQIGKRFGIHATHVSAIKLNKTWKNLK